MKKKCFQETGVNPLHDIHVQLNMLPIRFRERVCEECNWSIPTFYRKMRVEDKPDPSDNKRIVSVLSNAEKEKIIDVMNDLHMVVWAYCDRYRKNCK